jgi:hypothetical protein
MKTLITFALILLSFAANSQLYRAVRVQEINDDKMGAFVPCNLIVDVEDAGVLIGSKCFVFKGDDKVGKEFKTITLSKFADDLYNNTACHIYIQEVPRKGTFISVMYKDKIFRYQIVLNQSK